jgi:tetratricopeptide (TPR) repeat protein
MPPCPTTIVQNSTFTKNTAPTLPAIQIKNSPFINISNNVINGYGTGIMLESSGTTLSESIRPNDIIYSNQITNCKIGIDLYNSISNFKYNIINNNGVGLRLCNNSYTAFNNYLNPVTSPQIIKNNSYFELYADLTSFPVTFQWNQVYDSSLSEEAHPTKYPLIYWDIIRDEKPRDVSNNYWGSNFNPSTDFYPDWAFIYEPIWDLGGGITPGVGSLAETMYENGLNYFADENYGAAETTFINLINEYPESPFAIAALHELFALKRYTNNDFETLRGYFSTFTVADSTLYDVAQFLATRCNVMERNWEPAINWYENRIENPPSYPDSIFAVIDLGDIYLRMEADTTGGLQPKSKPLGRFPEIKPASKAEYDKNKSDLLATLPQKKQKQEQQPLSYGNTKGMLGQNIPNPASASTTIVYELYEKGVIEIRVYNALGQMIKTIEQGMQKEGIYQVTISLEKIPTGLYQYALYVDNVKIDAKKLVVNK